MIPENFLPVSQGMDANAIRAIDIDLSIARTRELVSTPGFSFVKVAAEAFTVGAIDYTKSVGVALLSPVSAFAEPLLLRAGENFKFPPSKDFYITNNAQPNSMMRIYLSTYPFTDASGNIVNSIKEYASPVGQNFSSNVSGDATIFTPAQNLRGAILRTGVIHARDGNSIALQIASASPATWFDATARTVMVAINAIVAGSFAQSQLPFPIFIPAGLGLFQRRLDGGLGGIERSHLTWDFK